MLQVLHTHGCDHSQAATRKHVRETVTKLHGCACRCGPVVCSLRLGTSCCPESHWDGDTARSNMYVVVSFELAKFENTLRTKQRFA